MNYTCAGLSPMATAKADRAVAQGVSSDPSEDAAARTYNGTSCHHLDSD